MIIIDEKTHLEATDARDTCVNDELQASMLLDSSTADIQSHSIGKSCKISLFLLLLRIPLENSQLSTLPLLE